MFEPHVIRPSDDGHVIAQSDATGHFGFDHVEYRLCFWCWILKTTVKEKAVAAELARYIEPEKSTCTVSYIIRCERIELLMMTSSPGDST